MNLQANGLKSSEVIFIDFRLFSYENKQTCIE